MPGKTAKYRSMNLTPEHAERLDKLCDDVALNRNQLMRLLIEALTPADVEKLKRRLGRD